MSMRLALVCLAAFSLAGTRAAVAQSSLSPIYRVVVEITHYNGYVYYSTAYETTNYEHFRTAKIAYQSAFENGDLQSYYGSNTSYVSNIYFPTIYPQLTRTRISRFQTTSRFSSTATNSLFAR